MVYYIVSCLFLLCFYAKMNYNRFMDQKEAKIILLADLHKMIVQPKDQKGQEAVGINKLAEWLISFWKKRNKKRIDNLEKIKGLDNFNSAFFLGDIIECEYNERGMITQNDTEEIKKFKAFLEEKFIPTKLNFISGDHELGYKLALSTDPQGGISQKSIDNFLEILGQLYQSVKIGNFHIIFLSSSLLHQDFSQRPEDEQRYIQSVKNKQEQFFVQKLREINNPEKAFVFLHNPDTLENIDGFLSEDLKNKIEAVFCGHVHAVFALAMYNFLGKIANSFLYDLISRSEGGKNIMHWAKDNPKRLALFKKYNLQVVPSVGGFFGIGKGFSTLYICENNYTIRRFKMGAKKLV